MRDDAGRKRGNILGNRKHIGGCIGKPRRGGHRPERGYYFLCFVFESGVNRGRGSGFINKFGNSTKSITFVVWVQR